MAAEKPNFETAREEIAAEFEEKRKRAERAQSLFGIMEKEEGSQRAVNAERLLWKMGLGGLVSKWKSGRKKNK
jgi:hypothetical protein